MRLAVPVGMHRRATSKRSLAARGATFFEAASDGCAIELAHPGGSIRPRSCGRNGRLAFLGIVMLVVGCGGSTHDGTGTTQPGDGSVSASGGRSTAGSSGRSGAGGRAGGGGQGGTGDVPATGGAESGGFGAGGSAGAGAGGAAGNAGSGGSSGAPGRVPAVHRAAAVSCDGTRPYFDAGAPKTDAAVGPPVECRTHADCTSGVNGRCVGNGHDGWRCTYDACFSDADCPGTDGGPGGGRAGVCACENGFRSDNNSCLYAGDCRTDADCGTRGYCSPTLGMCGGYAPFIGYYCHTAADECIDDADCTGTGINYCAWSELKGHWACSNSICVG